MDDPHQILPNTSEIKNILPDVVHSQQIPTVGSVTNDTETDIQPTETTEENTISHDGQESKTESISEHIPSKIEYSTDSDHASRTQDLLRVEPEEEKAAKNSSLNFPVPCSPVSDNPSTQDPSKVSLSLPLDVNAVSDIHLLSEESPVNLALSSDLSKDTHDKSQMSDQNVPLSKHDTPNLSPRSDKYHDSLNEESSHKSDVSQHDSADISDKIDSPEKVSSGSEEIIKLDIRGQGVPKFPFPAAKIIFGPPPEGGTVIDSNVEPIPVFPNLLSPFLVGAGDSLKVEEVFDDQGASKNPSPDKSLHLSPEKESLSSDKTLPLSAEQVSLSTDNSLQMSPDKQSLSSDKIEADLLVEEITVEDELKEKVYDKPEESSMPKSMLPEETMSFSTMTDYKTICEEYHVKLVHLEDAITQRDELIEELTISLQRSVRERDGLRHENEHLTNEVQNLQHIVGERSHSEHDTVKAQLSDFIKYQSLLKDDSTKFYSAVMSGGSSLQSSNGEKDMDREEIVINYSKSDLRMSDASDEFQTGFEEKLTTIINKFDSYIEENLRNKLRESLIQVLCDEIGKMRIENDTEIKELEAQLQSDKQAYTVETRRLRELLASVKAGNADIEALRQELDIKHEKEMENLRTYFEKKCSDMERSYSEEVWRDKACVSPCGSATSLDAPTDAAGDHARRRTRSALLTSLSLESTQLEQSLKHLSKKYEQQIDEMKAEHVAYVNELRATHREAIASLDEQITQLKAHIQTAENTETNVSLYQQDIDLELEKKMEVQLEARLDEVRDQVRQEVVNHLQEQLQVLLSDPDAEVSSWPLELVALRDKIHGETAKSHAEKECSSLRDELSVGEDKWKQRRNLSFDQNRQLEEVTRERDDLKRVAVSLHRVVGQLVAYCASAEDELNRTVLAQLLARLIPGENDTFIEEESRPTTPNLSTELNQSLVSRSGKHVHFAPDLNALLTDLDEEGIVNFLQQQRDLSADIKKELESSLRRLRHEAHSLLDLSAKLAPRIRRDTGNMLESSIQITELVQELDSKQNCDNCELHRKNMEEAMAECLQRENLLRSDLEAAMIKIAQLMTSGDVIAEGYGTGPQPGSGPCRARPQVSPQSLDGASSPRLQRLAHDLDSLQRERDDLVQQVKRMTDSPVHKICCEKLEAANRQLRSTRQFVEEQAAEREAERDDWARRERDLRDDAARLTARLQNNARILNEMHGLRLAHCNCRQHHAHVEQLEAQTREMNQIISELETRKTSTDNELKASEEKVSLLRDIIANLESQLEQKTTHENEILEQLEEMKNTIEERDSKMRTLLGELESLKSERVEHSDVVCVKCGQDEAKAAELMERVKEQCQYLEDMVHRRTRKMERIHEVCSTSCSEPSEDVSLRDQRHRDLETKSPDADATPRAPSVSELAGVWECMQAHARAEDAVLKRVADLEMQRAQLKDIAQEVRAERDVLQARMSEQALKISSLSARLQQQRNDAEALSHQATSQLSVQLHDALAEVQRLKEELESKDKQLLRVKQNLEEREKLHDEHHSLYGNSCNPKDKVIILERELSTAQSRIGQLESLARSLEKDKEQLHTAIRDHQRALAEKEDQLQELLALKLDEDNQKEENGDVLEGKASARTLSDIVSISEFDEQDLQMRRAELKGHNTSITGAHIADTTKERTLNRTLPPELEKANMSSLNLEYIDHFDLPGFTPRADSLPAHLTSTQNKDLLKQYKRNVNETTMFGIEMKHAQIVQDNCSMYPNRDANDSKDLSVEPKKINFSLETTDNKTHNDFTSLGELGITLDVKQENFPDILTQLKHEIKKSRTELDNCKSELKNAEEQLCEFPALKEEVEELKGLLENTMATMEHDKKFYENQLDNFSSNKKLLEQRLGELTQEVNDKSKDLHLLKEDILRRENMILELAKEKRTLTNRMTELEVKIDELQSKNNALEKYENDKVNELQKLQQLVSEKNQQIDSLNQHLDRLDDLQRCLNDKTEELDNLKEAFEEKSNEVFNLQDTVDALHRDISKLNEENDKLNTHNKDLKLKLTKLEKEQENASMKLQSNESELARVNSLNNELTTKIDELKLLTDKLKDKETEIEILHEDINAFHEEIASLKEQLKMVSRSPSPKNKSGDERKSLDRQASNDKKQLTKIRKQISLLQHELDFNKKELNDKAFELAKAKLDVTELRNNLSQANKQTSDKELDNVQLRQHADSLQRDIMQHVAEKEQLALRLQAVEDRIREESNVSELKNKLRQKVERCQELEVELENLRELVDRLRISPGREVPQSSDRALAVRSPTAELERALRDQLDYSHTLDEDIMEQILSASSDEREDIPRLALNTSKSSSSIHSSSSDRLNRLRTENDKLTMQVNNLEARLKDKDALIAELNRVRDKLVQDWQTCKLRYDAERDNAGRLQLLLDAQRDTAHSLQSQDSNMIQILKKRLEASMQSELELQQREQESRARLAQLQRQALDTTDPKHAQLQHEIENNERLKGEVSLLKSKLEVERSRMMDVQAMLDHARLQYERELNARNEHCSALKTELAEIKRLKHDAGVQLLRSKELINTQSTTIAELERKLASSQNHRPVVDALTEIESTKSELSRELAALKRCLATGSGGSPRQRRAAVDAHTQTAPAQTAPAQTAPEQTATSSDDRDHAIRYLHGRCLRLESCRKALVWQKRYLQRVLAGYTEFEKRLPVLRAPEVSKGKKRFKCIATAVVIVVRMGFLVRRRQHVRALSAHCILRAPPHATPAPNSQYGGTSPPARERGPPASARAAPDTLARRVLKHEMRLNLPASPGLGDFVRRSPYTPNSPQNDPFILSSPRGEVAAAYLNKLELVSRCLNHAMDASRDVP
ncbi:sporulation-specific protein 15 isoform X2 [Spodoptera litura]|uniref:Sporulation-specific protein 15 isoform X2 n=1 Tax=Spodoptera litura TaxID=69820 RepID=A0A9J7E190_SPOLT|nr:sporulation-specific protein 15 isoform X2 [Spodoptera litura]